MEAFATELIENIASHLDDATLLGFAEVSRAIRSKAYYIYGDRFSPLSASVFTPLVSKD
jgi:hypothetical protein